MYSKCNVFCWILLIQLTLPMSERPSWQQQQFETTLIASCKWFKLVSDVFGLAVSFSQKCMIACKRLSLLDGLDLVVALHTKFFHNNPIINEAWMRKILELKITITNISSYPVTNRHWRIKAFLRKRNALRCSHQLWEIVYYKLTPNVQCIPRLTYIHSCTSLGSYSKAASICSNIFAPTLNNKW